MNKRQSLDLAGTGVRVDKKSYLLYLEAHINRQHAKYEGQIIKKVCLPEHGLGLPKFVQQVRQEDAPDEDGDEEQRGQEDNEDRDVLLILLVEAIMGLKLCAQLTSGLCLLQGL